jgi:hypothetical protein
MKHESIIFECDEFKYPSSEEYKLINDKFPKIELFEFEYKFIPQLLIEEKQTIEDTYRLVNLYWWNNCLLNRLGKLRETYIYAITNFNRNVSYEYVKEKRIENLNGYMFDYYSELFYYFFSSTRDVIAQIINLYYYIGQKEDKVNFDTKLLNMVPDTNVRELLYSFFSNTKKASKIRNEFAHRFTPNNPDHRAVITTENGVKSIGFGGYKVISTDEITENMYQSLLSLQILMKELRLKLKNE